MGTVPLLIVGSHQLATQDYALGTTIWLLYAFAVIGPLVVANMLWFGGISRVGPSRAAVYANLQPFLAAVFSVLILSEPLSGLQVVGRPRDRGRDPALALPADSPGRGPRRRYGAGVSPIRERLARTPPGYRYSIGRILAIYSGLMVALLLAALDQTIVATALPRVVSELGGITQYSWVFTAYMLGATVTVPLYGRLGDVYGRKPLFIVAISIFLLGSALCGLSQSMVELVDLPRRPGTRRGRDLPAHARDDRDDRATARPRPLPGADRLRLRGRVDHRAADRRLHRRQPQLALDLLRQPPGRRRRARGDHGHDAAPATASSTTRSTGPAR